MTHGTDWGYANGCREACCRTVHARTAAAHRKRIRTGGLALGEGPHVQTAPLAPFLKGRRASLVKSYGRRFGVSWSTAAERYDAVTSGEWANLYEVDRWAAVAGVPFAYLYGVAA